MKKLTAKILSFNHTINDRDMRTEAVINKHTNIYPMVSSSENVTS